MLAGDADGFGGREDEEDSHGDSSMGRQTGERSFEMASENFRADKEGMRMAWMVVAVLPLFAQSREVFDKSALLTLARAGFTDQFIAERAQAGQDALDLTAEGLAELRKEGVSERLLRLLIAQRTVSACPVPAAGKKEAVAASSWWATPAAVPETPVAALPAKPKPKGHWLRFWR
jgi:hypothetical protein